MRIVYRATVIGGRLRDEVDGSTNAAQWFLLTNLPERRTAIVDAGIELAALPPLPGRDVAS